MLFISALDATLDKVRAFEAGGLDYIPKPFQREEVLARVDVHLAPPASPAGIFRSPNGACCRSASPSASAENPAPAPMLSSRTASSVKQVREAQSFGELIGQSAALRYVVGQIDMSLPPTPACW